MSHRNAIGIALVGGALMLGGCAAAPQQVNEVDLFAELLAPQQTDETVALAAIGESLDDDIAAPKAFHLGAGDTLGQAVFIGYVAYCRANGRPDGAQYATGAEESY